MHGTRTEYALVFDGDNSDAILGTRAVDVFAPGTTYVCVGYDGPRAFYAPQG